MDNLLRTASASRANLLLDSDDDPLWWDWDNSVGGYWPRLRESTPIRSTIRAR